jgi:hypothetical protein
MLIRLKTLLLIVSSSFNVLFIIALVLSAASKSNTASLSFPAVEDGYAAAAALALFPASSELVFNPVEITLKPAQKTYLQYSLVNVNGQQTNIFVSALYDPQIIAIEYSGPGIAVTALREGETLMQYIANDGIKDLAHITVTK